jgi:hypothetical protein
MHLWKKATVVVINKPQKPDYSVPKAYQPIALMECIGKLLEKIVAKRINADIEHFNLLPMSQFGSRPHHSTINTVATLVHKIQGMRATRHAGTLLLFDILGFFNNINPGRAVHILHNKGFPTNVCDWALSFLTGCTASLKIGTYESSPFPILNGMPQGSPLSPILSVLYTSSLIEASERWMHCNLSMYVDNGAIYTVSATTTAVASRAHQYYMEVLKWLDDNGLQADPSKTELMMFRPTRANPNLTGADIMGARYTDPNLGPNHITTVSHLLYLGVYIDHRLNWTRHITIMANRTCSNIRGINILGNSIRGLDFLNWQKVYNALIILGLTYGA